MNVHRSLQQNGTGHVRSGYSKHKMNSYNEPTSIRPTAYKKEGLSSVERKQKVCSVFINSSVGRRESTLLGLGYSMTFSSRLCNSQVRRTCSACLLVWFIFCIWYLHWQMQSKRDSSFLPLCNAALQCVLERSALNALDF